MSRYGMATAALATVTVGLGVALIAVTLAHGGGIGLLFGVLFVAAGAGRLWLVRARGSRR